MKRSTLYLWLGIIMSTIIIIFSIGFFYGFGMSDGAENLDAAIFITAFFVTVAVGGFLSFLYLYFQQKRAEEQAEEVQRFKEQEKRDIEQRKNEKNHV